MFDNFSDQITDDNKAVEEQITLTVGEKGETYLRLLKETGVDLTWLKEAKVKCSFNTKDNDVEMSANIALNGKSIISPEFIFDSKKTTAYVKVPELTKDTAKYTLEDEYAEKIKEALDKAAELRKAYPSSKDVDKLLNRYVKLILAEVKDVERQRGVSLDCDEVSQKCTVVKATFKEKDIKSIVKKVCDEASKDKDLKNIMQDFFKALDMEDNFDDAYDSMVNSLENVADNIEDMEFGLDKITVELYVDGSTKIVGVVVTISPENGEKATLKIGTATKGSNVGYEASFKSADTTIKFSGSGKKSGSKITGDYDLKVNGERLMKVKVEKFDLDAWENGYLKGHFTASFDVNLDDLNTSSLPREIRRAIRNYGDVLSNLDLGLDLIIDLGEKKHSIDLGVLSSDEEVFRIAFKGSVKSGSKVKIPSKAVDVSDPSDLEEFIGDLDFDKILDAIEAADAPSSITKMLREMMN